MKNTFVIGVLLLSLAMTSCTTNEGKSKDQKVEQQAEEVQEKKFPKAACILWIDKNKEKTLNNKVVRNVKAKVHIDNLGKITVLEYEKEPHFLLLNKIERCLKTYRVTPEQKEKGRLKEGVNYVFLRFVERELKNEARNYKRKNNESTP